MRTSFRVRQPYLEIFLHCAEEHVCRSPARPTRFMRKMLENTGMAGAGFGLLDEQELERKNPVIVALGDSVTAGHFESLMTPERIALTASAFEKLKAGTAPAKAFAELTRKYGTAPIEVCDARESYIEKFREMLIEKYEQTSVSVVNSGIAGDVLPSMAARAERDVIRYDPDLILINGSLNWDDARFGDAEMYKAILKALVRRFKAGTTADIVLMTPNGDLPNTMFSAPGQGAAVPTTAQRAAVIRELAQEEKVCLADVREVWETARDAGCPWEELLANRINHPSVEGHLVYAKVLMKLFDGE